MTFDDDLPVRVLHGDDLTRENLVALAGPRPQPRVSFHLPTHTRGREVRQDPVRLRNLIAAAERELGDHVMLSATLELANRPDFWEHGTHGLSVLVDEANTTVVRLAAPVPELFVVSDRFHLKPLVRAANQRVDFDVLALSRDAARLVRSTGSRVSHEDVQDLPAGVADALRWDDRERQLQSRSAGRSGAGSVTAAFHGHGGRDALRNSDLARYARLVDAAVCAHRGHSTRPLVLAGVEDLRSTYRSVTACTAVVDGDIAGNPDRLTPAELAERARPHVQPAAARAERAVRDTLLATNVKMADTIESVAIAAVRGQVDAVFVPDDRSYWGRVEPDGELGAIHPERRPGDHDLADVAATETIRLGGDAFIVSAGDVPGGATAAAILRH